MLRTLLLATMVASGVLLTQASPGLAAPGALQPQAQEQQARFVLPSVAASPGETVTVPLSAVNIPSPGVTVFNLAVSFDTSSLELVRVGGGDAPLTRPSVAVSGGTVRIAHVQSRGVSGDFNVAVLEFRVSPDASGVIPLEITTSGAIGNAGSLQIGRQDGRIDVGSGATATPLTPTPTFPPPTQAPTLQPTPAPTLKPEPSPAAPTPDVTPPDTEIEEERPTPTPNATADEPVIGVITPNEPPFLGQGQTVSSDSPTSDDEPEAAPRPEANDSGSGITGNAVPGVLLVLVTVLGSITAAAWTARLAAIIRGHQG
ncbi:MAG: cohesin domain-containing protein [Dehalococcoidia bacterium]